MWWVGLAWGQEYERQPCEPLRAELRSELAAGMVSRITPLGPSFALASASSVLPPPASYAVDLAAIDANPNLIGREGPARGWMIEDAKSCAYGAPNLVDREPTTAWCEGVAGPGVGEVVVIELPGPGPLELRNGYGKSPELFRKNGRVRRVEVVLLGPGWQPPVQGTMFASLPVGGRHEVELADVEGWQPLPLPPWTEPVLAEPPGMPGWYPKQVEPRFVALRIVSVWPGDTWEDTCVSEVRARVGPE